MQSTVVAASPGAGLVGASRWYLGESCLIVPIINRKPVDLIDIRVEQDEVTIIGAGVVADGQQRLRQVEDISVLGDAQPPSIDVAGDVPTSGPAAILMVQCGLLIQPCVCCW